MRGTGAEQAVVRVTRVDSGEALDAAPIGDQGLEGQAAHAFRARGLSRGLHHVLVGAPRRGWVDAGTIEISGGRGPESIEVELPDPARLVVTNGGAPRLRFEGRRAGMRVVSPDVLGPEGRQILAAPGTYDLQVERAGGPRTLRSLDLASGAAVRVE